MLPPDLRAAADPVDAKAQVNSLSLADLERRLVALDHELNQLASLSLLSGVGSVGYRSQVHTSPTDPESIRIDLGNEATIDQIVLVPTLWRDTKTAEDFFVTLSRCASEQAGRPLGFTPPT